MTGRYNFSPGPSMLPAAVKARIIDELPDWNNTGFSVMEVSHRSAEFDQLATDSTRLLRQILAIPEDYAVLFMQGGASTQFALSPMNLSTDGDALAYHCIGQWGIKAAREAARIRRVTTLDEPCSGQQWRLSGTKLETVNKAAFLHVTDNETIEGVRLPGLPVGLSTAIVCDMSSSILSRPLNVSNYGLIYAGAQKNAGIAGVTVLIIRRDLLSRCSENLPSMLNYAVIEKTSSMLNTPASFPWYVMSLVLEWIADEGGLDAMASRNRRKASLLYDCIDSSQLYRNAVPKAWRSDMNAVFNLDTAATEQRFLAYAAEQGFSGLKGHRLVGGCRASIYNAMPLDSVEALVGLMNEFERIH